jgi:hypothetical protein
MSNDTPKRRINESRDIHPLVAVWLTKNGYSYTHEYKLPDYGRVDFFATHSDGHKLLVEAKPEKQSKVITQLSGYGVQIPEARLSIALPKEEITPSIEAIAQKYNVGIISLDVDYSSLSPSKETASGSFALFSTLDRLDFIQELHKSPERITDEILGDCKTPVAKILNLWMLHELVFSYGVAIDSDKSLMAFFADMAMKIAEDNLETNPYLIEFANSVFMEGDTFGLIAKLNLGWFLPPMNMLTFGGSSQE